MNIYNLWKTITENILGNRGHDVIEVAWFIHKILSERRNVDDVLNIRISKYLYIAHAWSLVLYNRPLINTKAITLQSTPGVY